mgnify:CR=1 FL=1
MGHMKNCKLELLRRRKRKYETEKCRGESPACGGSIVCAKAEECSSAILDGIRGFLCGTVSMSVRSKYFYV